MRRIFYVLFLLLTACGVQIASGTNPSDKVFVCKYVSKPGEAERLQTGQNPISVSVNSLVGPGEDVHIGDSFQDGQFRSVVIAFDVGQPEPDVSECPPPHPPPTTTTEAATTTAPTTTTSVVTTNPQGNTTTTGATTSTSSPTTTSLRPTTTSSSTSTTAPSTTTTTTSTTPTSTTQPGSTTTTGGTSSTSTSSTSTTTTTSSGPTTSTTAPPSNSTTTSTPSTSSSSTVVAPTSSSPTTVEQIFFGGATTVCIREVPTIAITFGNLTQFNGHVGTLTMADINGNVVSVQDLVYQAGTTVNILYPGTRVNPDGSIADVPGWNLTADGFWVRDPSDAFLREGISLSYFVNPSASAFVTYPPESSACANPSGPFPPAATTTTITAVIPVTGSGGEHTAALATLIFGAGWFLIRITRRRVQ